MFTGFATENTPSIQVWNCFSTMASAAVPSISLTDDCAPIQFFKTGSSTLILNVYLPAAPIEGKVIRIINSRFGSSYQSIELFASDNGNSGAAFPVYSLGAGQQIELAYTKNAISFGSLDGFRRTGWISLNISPSSAVNYYGAAVGGRNNRVGAFAGVLSGDGNAATGDYSSATGGQSNTASGQYSAVIGNTSSNVSGFGAFAGGANQGTVSGNGAVILGGQACTASGLYSAVINGAGNTANAECSVAVGGARGTTRAIVGNFVSTASVDTISPVSGISQRATLLLGRQTTDATATRLTSNTSAAGTTNQVILPNNSAYTFQGTCIAAKTAAGDTSSWKFEGAIKRGANAASTVLVAAVTPTVIAQDAGASTWVLAITADTTNGGIAVTVTGQAATTIRWVCKIETTEVTF